MQNILNTFVPIGLLTLHGSLPVFWSFNHGNSVKVGEM